LDAIADENVLGVLVEYYKGQQDTDLFSEKRMTEIAQFILNNFNKSTFDGEYNALFGTAFATDNFSAYYDDINLRMKKKKSDMEPLDLLLVVGMFLAGFDAKKLNTLYVDKNLEWHGLI